MEHNSSLPVLPSACRSNDTLVALACPGCRRAIVNEGPRWKCPSCGRFFVYNRGILSFLSPEDRFNEGDFEEKQINAWNHSASLRDKIRRSRLLAFLNLIRIKFSLSGRRDRLFYNEMRHGSRDRLILDIGCGGGRHYFCDYGKVVGVEPVLGLAIFASQVYDAVYQASALNLPFADGSFDYVVSSDVIGHIPNDKKDQLFSEMYRVLKTGGRTVHVSEADAVSPMFKFAHRYPDLFQTHFVCIPGHIGLELPSELKRRFEKHGFNEVTCKKLSSNLHELGTWAAYFDNEYKTKSTWLGLVVTIDRLLSRSFLVKEVLHFALEPLAQLDDCLTPLDYTSGVLVVFEK